MIQPSLTWACTMRKLQFKMTRVLQCFWSIIYNSTNYSSIAALFTIATTWEDDCPLTDEWTKKNIVYINNGIVVLSTEVCILL